MFTHIFYGTPRGGHAGACAPRKVRKRRAAGGRITRRLGIALTCALLLHAAACSKPDEGEQSKGAPAAKSDLPSIVFLGDSLTAGRGLPLELSMPSMVARQIQADGLRYRVINAGRSGDTTAGGLARLPWYLRKENKVRMLVIGLGSNDAMRGQPVESMAANLRSIVQATRRFDATITIALFQMHTFPNMGKQYAGSYERMFRDVARREKIVLLPFPLTGVAGVSKLNQPDGIHPTEQGTEMFAANVWKALRPHVLRLPSR